MENEKREAGSGKREAGSGKREAGSGKREAGSGQWEMIWYGLQIAIFCSACTVLHTHGKARTARSARCDADLEFACNAFVFGV